MNLRASSKAEEPKQAEHGLSVINVNQSVQHVKTTEVTSPILAASKQSISSNKAVQIKNFS